MISGTAQTTHWLLGTQLFPRKRREGQKIVWLEILKIIIRPLISAHNHSQGSEVGGKKNLIGNLENYYSLTARHPIIPKENSSGRG